MRKLWYLLALLFLVGLGDAVVDVVFLYVQLVLGLGVFGHLVVGL